MTIRLRHQLWKELFEDAGKKEHLVNLSLEGNRFTSINIQECFTKVLVNSIKYVDINLDEDSESAKLQGSSFIIDSEHADSLELGVCPLVVNTVDGYGTYKLMEPLTVMSGMKYILSHEALGPTLLQDIVDAMFLVGNTEQARGSYFDLFIGMKLATSKKFRQGLYAMACQRGALKPSTSWIMGNDLPDKSYFELCHKIDDDRFVNSLGNTIDTSVLMPSLYAGPDVKWWKFLIAVKTSWINECVAPSKSFKNETATDPLKMFLWRKRKRDDMEEDRQLPAKRGALNEACVDLVDTGRYNFIRVRTEIPFSNVHVPDDAKHSDRLNHKKAFKSDGDIFLCLHWKDLAELLDDKEVHVFEKWLKTKTKD